MQDRQSPQPIKLTLAERLELLKGLPDRLNNAINALADLSNDLDSTDLEGIIAKVLELGSVLPKSVDLGQFKGFLENPYFIYSKEPNSIKTAVPKFMRNFHPSWIIGENESFHLYEMNVWTKWLGVEWPQEFQMPQEISQMLKDRPKIPITIEDGVLVTSPEYKSEVLNRYRAHLSGGRDGRYRVARGHMFDLLASLIKDGYMPYSPNPVKESDLRSPNINFELRPYEKEAFEEFLRFGAIGVFWPPAGGKTYLGLYAMASLKGRKLVVVPTKTLEEQWLERVRDLTGMDSGEIDVVTYQSRNIFDKRYTLTIFDECQHLPANVFSRLATVNTQYRIGLSASPYREDGRTEFIFALTGKPVGANWTEFIKQGILKYPEVTVYLAQTPEDKTRMLQELLRENHQGKTLVYCDGINLGLDLSEKLGIPFIYGVTTKRMEVIRNNKIAVISRVGDEGISLPDLERVIEYSFFGGSRRQELQRAGRLLHSHNEDGRGTSHTVLMTQVEYQKYLRRFHGIIERGMTINVVRQPYAA